MKKYLHIVLLTLVLTGCKSKKIATSGQITKTENAKDIINQHNKLSYDFETVAISGSMFYKDNKQSQRVNVEIRCQKDKQILIIVRLLGFTGAKALITPNSVQYYEKVNNTYFDGDFSLISNWLGTDIDFQKLQNVMLGMTIESLEAKDYNTSIEQGWLALTSFNDKQWNKTYWFENKDYLLKKQSFSKKKSNDLFEVFYNQHQITNFGIFPKDYLIKAQQPSNDIVIDLELKQFNFNQNMTFPYKVPSGYKEIILK